jgi:hypothetical protein
VECCLNTSGLTIRFRSLPHDLHTSYKDCLICWHAWWVPASEQALVTNTCEHESQHMRVTTQVHQTQQQVCISFKQGMNLLG